MKISKGEWAAIFTAVILLSFVGGLFVGRSTAPEQVTITGMATAVSQMPEETPKASQSPTVSWPIDLNSAGEEQLMSLPGIGETLAQRILDYRRENGDFQTIEELKNVSGIGDKIFEELQSLVEVREQHEDSSSG